MVLRLAVEAQGIVYRDLKPANIMLVAADADPGTRGGPMPQVNIIDFGLAKVVAAAGASSLSGGGTRGGGFVGTPSFAGPEQSTAVSGDEAGVRADACTDIYALGITTWLLLCGRMSFEGETLGEIHVQQTRQPLPLTQLHAAWVPPWRPCSEPTWCPGV